MARYRAVIGDIKFEPEDKDDVHLVAKIEILPKLFSKFGKKDKDEREAVLGLISLDVYADYNERYNFIRMLRYARDEGLEVAVEGFRSDDNLVLRDVIVESIKDKIVGRAHSLTQLGNIALNKTLSDMLESIPERRDLHFDYIGWVVDLHAGKVSIEPDKGNLGIFAVRNGEQYKILVPTEGYTQRERDMLYTLLMFGEDRTWDTRLRIVGERKGPIISPARISNIYVRGKEKIENPIINQR